MFFRKFFKKVFRHSKRRIATINRKKTWIFIRPNYVLTKKSKNARMGKGKGNFKRWCTIVYPGRTFIEHVNTSLHLYKNFVKKMSIKTKLDLKITSIYLNKIKNTTTHGICSNKSSIFELIRIRKQLTKKFFI